MDEVKEAQKKAIEIQEPPMYTVQMSLKDCPWICYSALEEATNELGSFSAMTFNNFTVAISLLGSRNGFLDLSQEMTKEMADQLYPKVLDSAVRENLACGCHRPFKLRLEKTK